MARFIILQNNIVSNIIEADAKFIYSYSAKNPEMAIMENDLGSEKVASIGDTYSPEKGLFIPAQPFDSWTYNELENQWISPIEYPSDGIDYWWDEQNKKWSKYR